MPQADAITEVTAPQFSCKKQPAAIRSSAQSLPLTRAVTLPPNFAGARGHVDMNPTASFVLTVTPNGTAIGTGTIATLGAVSFATTGGTTVSLAAGDVVRFLAPGTPDATIAGIALTLSGSLT